MNATFGYLMKIRRKVVFCLKEDRIGTFHRSALRHVIQVRPRLQRLSCSWADLAVAAPTVVIGPSTMAWIASCPSPPE